MAKPKQDGRAVDSSAAQSSRPDTIRVSVIFRPPLGTFLSLPGQPKDPGRYMAGRFWAPNELVETDVSLEQLGELEADSYLDVRYEGKPEKPVTQAPTDLASLQARISDLTQKLHDAERRAIEAQQIADENTRVAMMRMRTDYETRIAKLEAKLPVRDREGDRELHWFPEQPDVDHERQRALAGDR